MRGLERELYEEKQRLYELLNALGNELEIIKEPRGNISVAARGNSFQFYIRQPDDTLKYLSTKEKDKAINIVKAEYYSKLKAVLEKRLSAINRMMISLEKNDSYRTYEMLGKGKQELIKPFVLSDKLYREEWEKCEYIGKSFSEDSVEIYTDRGERVRSKSEKIIADKLYRENIAYRYEYPLEIPYVGTFYPDFTILDERKRRNIILEHFGLMDHEEYAINAVAKIQIYEKEGYVLGDNFFMTMETSRTPLDSRSLDRMIEQIKG